MAAPIPRARNLRGMIKTAQNAQEKKAMMERLARTMEAARRKRSAQDRLAGIQQTYQDYLRSVIQIAVDEGLVPVSLGNLLGPEGNIFPMMGSCRDAIRSAAKHGIPVSEGAMDVVDNYTSRSYDETLTMIQMYYLDIDDSIARFRAWQALSDEARDRIPTPNQTTYN